MEETSFPTQNGIICYCCQRMGHYAANCPENPKRNPLGTNLSKRRITKHGENGKVRRSPKLCRYFLNGCCRDGDDCAFSHDPYGNVKYYGKQSVYPNLGPPMAMYPVMAPYRSEYMYDPTLVYPPTDVETTNDQEEEIVEEGDQTIADNGEASRGPQTTRNMRYNNNYMWVNPQHMHQYYPSSMPAYGQYPIPPYMMHGSMASYPVHYMNGYHSNAMPLSQMVPSQSVDTSTEPFEPTESFESTSNYSLDGKEEIELDEAGSISEEKEEKDDEANEAEKLESVDSEEQYEKNLESVESSSADDVDENIAFGTLKTADDVKTETDKVQEESQCLERRGDEWSQEIQKSPAKTKSSPPTKLLKGLANDGGQNNCFLNVVIQVIFHMKTFQEEIETKNHRCSQTEKQQCIHCSIINVFNNLSEANEDYDTNASRTSPMSVRQALSSLSSCFDEGSMNDAAEAHQVILEALHECLSSAEDYCTFDHFKKKIHQNDEICVVHQYFGMYIREKAICYRCQQIIHGNSYGTTIVYVPTTNLYQLKDEQVNFGSKLSSALVGDSRKCTNKNCMNSQLIACNMTMENVPRVLTLGFTWTTTQADVDFLLTIINSIEEYLVLGETFHDCRGESRERKYRLTSMICYHGAHYTAFCYEQKTKGWFSFNDEVVNYIGTEVSDVLQVCRDSAFQPLLLFYSLLPEEEKIQAFEFMVGDIRISAPNERRCPAPRH